MAPLFSEKVLFLSNSAPRGRRLVDSSQAGFFVGDSDTSDEEDSAWFQQPETPQEAAETAWLSTLDFDTAGNLQRDNSHLYHKDTSSTTPLTLKNRTWDLSGG